MNNINWVNDVSVSNTSWTYIKYTNKTFIIKTISYKTIVVTHCVNDIS